MLFPSHYTWMRLVPFLDYNRRISEETMDSWWTEYASELLLLRPGITVSAGFCACQAHRASVLKLSFRFKTRFQNIVSYNSEYEQSLTNFTETWIIAPELKARTTMAPNVNTSIISSNFGTTNLFSQLNILPWVVSCVRYRICCYRVKQKEISMEN